MRTIYLFVLLLLGSTAFAQDRNGARASERPLPLQALAPEKHKQRLDKDLYARMALPASTKQKVDKVMTDFLNEVEKQKADPKNLTKTLMDRTIAARNKKLEIILGRTELKKFLDCEKQMPPLRPDPMSMIKVRNQN